MKILLIMLTCLILAMPALAENCASGNGCAEMLVRVSLKNQEAILSNQVMILQNQAMIIKDLNLIKEKLNKRRLPQGPIQQGTTKELEKQKAIGDSLKTWVQPAKGKTQ
jgi:hypothetical protein